MSAALAWNVEIGEAGETRASFQKFPKQMTTEELVQRVTLGFRKISAEIPYILELRARFGRLPRGRANIASCSTWKEFCVKVLHRSDSRIRQVIAAHSALDQNHQNQFWLTPRDLYARLDAEFHFDYDAAPFPRPDGYDGTTVPWGKMSYCNPPFRLSDAYNGKGPTSFAFKAIEESRMGRGSVLVLPCHSYVNALLLAGAEIRALGRVPWENPEGSVWRGPTSVALFVLRGK